MDVLIGSSSSQTNPLFRHFLASHDFRSKPARLSPTHHLFDEIPDSENTVVRKNLFLGSLYTRRREVCKVRLAMRSGGLDLAHRVFDEMPLMDTFAWNNLIQTYLCSGDLGHVVFTYEQMLVRGIHVDRRTIPRVLSAISRLSGDLSAGKQFHGQAVKLGFSEDQYIITALLEMYGRLESADKAKRLIHDKCQLKSSVSWTLLTKLYINEGKPGSAIELFREMVDSGTEIDRVAMATGIGAAAVLKSLKDGQRLHNVAAERGLDCDVLVSNSLLKMYIDCGSIASARVTFDKMPSKDLISWTEIIQAYVKIGEYNEGLKLFRMMIASGLRPDPLSISSLLPACARMTTNKQGREIHGHLLRNGVELNLHVINALIDMYAKSGFIESASKMFARLKCRDAISWTMMIYGYSLHGKGELGLELFRELEKELSRVEIDQVAYAAVLHACATARNIEEGKLIFDRINAPRISHFVSMATMLANSGQFNEAMRFAQERKVARHPDVLRAVLDGCRVHGNTKLGKRVTEQLSEVEPLNADNYVLLSNWYASDKKWDAVTELKGMIGDMGLKPKKAFSWIELRNRVHVFGTGDLSHPRSVRIYSELESLMKRIEEKGLSPNMDYTLHCVDEERECIGVGHSEMLAISFGLISTPIGATVRVTKNHRVCRFCHEAVKAISAVTEREIVLKDPNRFHHFRGGSCSCNDFW